ncbi:hypothetical protein LSH36_929g00077, partial [Paralvinella palmiformis]
ADYTMAYRQERRGPNRNRYDRSMGYHQLKELVDKSDEDILNVISNRQSGFVNVINRESLKPDWISLVLQISTKACKYCEEPLNGYAGSGNSVDTSRLPSARLMTYLNDVRISKFLGQCLTFVCGLLAETGQRHFCRDIKNILILCKTMLNVMPTNIEQVLPLITSVEMVVRTLRSQNKLSGDDEDLENILEEATRLCQQLMNSQLSKVDDMQKDNKRRTHREHLERKPITNFRELSIFPTELDLLHPVSNLPKIKESGKYPSVESYLDTHFRLLREDFMRPLRQGINNYLNTTRKLQERQQLQNVRIYQNVHVKYPVCTPDGISYKISFDVNRLHSVRWENTKRLIYGALVCLSPDSFKTIYWATVSHRHPEQLKNGTVEVRFQNATAEVSQIGTNQKLIMAESAAYFEAYRHVLQGLKNLHEENLPFLRYLVTCEKDVQVPQYLKRMDKPKYDLSQLMEPDDHVLQTVAQYNTANVAILEKRSWPPAHILGLDPSQWEAVHLALTKELALIQGPPGTGKTYIGFKVMRALLQNDFYWKNNEEEEIENNPILLICYTNHALDQFLEGICKFVHTGIVRVGGRSKSQVLEQFVLHELRKLIRERKDVPVEVHRNRMDAMDQEDRVRSEIEQLTAAINASTKGFLRETCLQEFMEVLHFEQLLRRKPDHRKSGAFSIWLGIDNKAAFKLYAELTSKKSDDGGRMQDDGNRGQDAAENEKDEMEADEDNENVEDNRLLLGVDDVDQKTGDHRRKKIMAKALENIALKFSDLITRSKQDKAASASVTEEQKVKYLLDVNDIMSEDEARNNDNIWRLDMKDRWRLYRCWLKQYRRNIDNQLRALEQEYELTARRLHEVKQREDLEIMKRAKILGMTTTAAARYRDLLHEIRPKIVVVEEAAEVLEAHIITALTSGCQHLILIGDHKQLRPSPTDYQIAEKFKLKISLFERLANNRLPYAILGLQHRMPANISKLLQFVYKQNLRDHPSLHHWSPIRGLTTNLFFVEHNQQETENKDLKSKVNKHEANYLIALSRYLVLQGYIQKQITILTPYTGQLARIRKLLHDKQMQEIRTCAIDNFQGEENDIVLVSLVRSNDEGRIGFVGDDNRICVTLSRAKKGMILIGDSSILSQMNSLWSKVIQSLRADGCIGPTLTLCCVNHKDQIILAKTAQDFDRAPEGGCMQPCQARLKCGHACTRVCHAYDTEHLEYKCQKKCEKKCTHFHPCHKKCFEPCGDCEQIVKRRLSRCGHIQNIPCNKDNDEYRCQADCSVRLLCGHKCRNKCSEPHTLYCPQLVKKRLLCGHDMLVKCHLDPENALCETKCSVQLECDHSCVGTCGKCMEGRLHLPCQAPCKKILICGHECKASCHQSCPPCSAKCENKCAHSICQQKCGVPCIPCMEPCAWRCKHYRCTKRCHEPCDRPRCNKACEKILPCRHKCIGLCGEPCPKKCRICDEDEVLELFFGTEDAEDALFVELEDCGHIIEVSSLDKWMDSLDDSSMKNEAVKLKGCPKCTLPIRRNLRYGKTIKKKMELIEKVKVKVLGSSINGHSLQKEIQNSELQRLDPEAMEIIKTRLDKKWNEVFTEEESVCIKNLVKLLCRLSKLSSQIKEQIRDVSSGLLKQKKDLLIMGTRFMRAWLLKERKELSKQEEQEARGEISRLYLVALTLECDIKIQKTEPAIPLIVERRYIRAGQLLDRKSPLTVDDERTVKDALKEMERFVPRTGLGITEEERIDILQAINLTKGHWYHCPNGHVYCIGECGGAMEEAKCPECNATIGGKNHALHQGNAVATEMDGARHAAWSEHANLNNYDIDLLG